MLSVQDSKNIQLSSSDFKPKSISLPSITISFEGIFTDPSGINYWMIATRRGNSAGGIGNQIVLTRLSDQKSVVFEAGDGVIKEPLYVPSTHCLYGVNSDPADLWKIDLKTMSFQTLIKSNQGLADKMMKSLILGTDGQVHIGGMNKGALASFNPQTEKLYRWGIIDRPEGDSTKFYRMVYYLAETPDAFGISIRDINLTSWYFVWKDKKTGKETAYFKGETNEKVGVQTLKSKDGKKYAFKVNCIRKPGQRESFLFENNSMKPLDAETQKNWIELSQETTWKTIEDFKKSTGILLVSSNIDAPNRPYLLINQNNKSDSIFLTSISIDPNRPLVFCSIKNTNYWSSGKYQPLFSEKNGKISVVAKLPMISAYSILPDPKGESIFVAGYPSIWTKINVQTGKIDTLLNGNKFTKYFTRQISLGDLIIAAGNHERDTVGSEVYFYNLKLKQAGKFMTTQLESFLSNKSILNLTSGKGVFYITYKAFGNPEIQALEVVVKKNEIQSYKQMQLPISAKGIFIHPTGNLVCISDSGVLIRFGKSQKVIKQRIEGSIPTFPKHHLNSNAWLDSNMLLFWTSTTVTKKSTLYAVSVKSGKIKQLFETTSAYNSPSMEATDNEIYLIRQSDPLINDQYSVFTLNKKKVISVFGK